MYHNRAAYNDQSYSSITRLLCDSWALVEFLFLSCITVGESCSSADSPEHWLISCWKPSLVKSQHLVLSQRQFRGWSHLDYFVSFNSSSTAYVYTRVCGCAFDQDDNVKPDFILVSTLTFSSVDGRGSFRRVLLAYWQRWLGQTRQHRPIPR